jgi:putative salt-induced outer membrane protein YdiY
MSATKTAFWSAALVASLVAAGSAQTNQITVTNYVTITITNVVAVASPTRAPALPGAPVAKAPEKPARRLWTNSVTVGLSLVRGDKDTTMVSAEYSASKKTPSNEYLGSVRLSFGEQNSKETADSYKGMFQWNHVLTDRFYNYARLEGERDYVADVDYRLMLGPGVGYYLLKETNTTLAVGGGVNFQAQSLENRTDNYAAVRLADKFEYKINKYARIWQNLEALPQVDRWDNYLVDLQFGAETAVAKSFSLKTYLDDTYNNHPAFGHLKNDARIMTAVAYKF